MSTDDPARTTIQFPRPTEDPPQPVPVLRRLGVLNWSTIVMAIGIGSLIAVSIIGVIGDSVPRAVVTLSISAIWAGFFLARGMLDREHAERRIAASEARTHALLTAEFQSLHDQWNRSIGDMRAHIAKVRTEVCASVDSLPRRAYTYAESATAAMNAQADAALAEDDQDETVRLLCPTPARGLHIVKLVSQPGSRD